MIARKLLVLDASFSYEAINERGLVESVTCRDLGGFFQHVWSVHPFATLVTSRRWCSKYGKPQQYEINQSHTFIEGKIGYSKVLERFPAFNFITAQLQIFFFLFFLIKKNKISVIRVGDPLYLGILGYLLSKCTGTPLVVRVGANNEKIRANTRSPIMPRLFKNIYQERLVEKFVLSRANLVAGANKDNLQFAIDNGANPQRCTLFRYGNLIDKSHYVPPSSRPPNDLINIESTFLLCIARLEPIKRVDDVIHVLSILRSRGHEISAVIVGDGRERANLELLSRNLQISRHVNFCGNRSQQWLASVIPRASVVISPHTGRALVEAALGAAPIVAYDIDWQSEIIETGITGELVPFGSVDALAQAASKLLENHSYSRMVGEQVRARVLHLMDPDALNEHERIQYSKLISPQKDLV
jgi:glycosyltransferase involved in cell wall biosynthesis